MNWARLVAVASLLGVVVVAVHAVASKANVGPDHVVISSPPPGGVVTGGDVIEGTVEGEGEVYVWLKGVDFAVPVERHGSDWSYTYPGGLLGLHTLFFAAGQLDSLGPSASRSFDFHSVDAPLVNATSSSSPTHALPDSVAMVFRPVDQTITAAVALVDGVVQDQATGGGDLDHNGVSDLVQKSTRGWGMPYGWIMLGAVAGAAIWVLVARR